MHTFAGFAAGKFLAKVTEQSQLHSPSTLLRMRVVAPLQPPHDISALSTVVGILASRLVLRLELRAQEAQSQKRTRQTKESLIVWAGRTAGDGGVLLRLARW